MAAKSASKGSRPAKQFTGRVIKASKPTSTSKRSAKPKEKGKTKEAARPASEAQSLWAARDKKYQAIFGAAVPKGKVLTPDGTYTTANSAHKHAVCVAQFAPCPDRMNWVYVTHGLSQSAPARTEFVLLWRQRDNEVTARILNHAARYVLETGNAIAPNQIITGQDLPELGATGFQHWLVCKPEASIPEQIEQGRGKASLLILLGITDAELQVALKVNPSFADGRAVLLEALRCGGVFPVTDPARNCLTRRRDFNRLWETAFRIVKERQP